LRAEIVRLNKIIQALMNRAERSMSVQGTDFTLFQTAIVLEEQVRTRTADLERALRENEKINRALQYATEQMELEIQERKRIQEELLALQAQLRQQVIHDPLTSLYNRRYLDEMFDRELARAERHAQPISVILIDVDYFKSINDKYGHLAGDEVLRIFGDIIKHHSRGSDICCRYGGEEFLLVLPNMSEQQAYARAEQLRVAIEDTPIVFSASDIRVTASSGVATFPQHGRTKDELIAASDRALYAAKAAGRNQVKRYTLSPPS
jgi:diguanylate cyclase (GGDEF)-like protein